MRTEWIRVDPERPDPAALAGAAAIVREGQVVAFPTETVYGLAADAANPAAIQRLRELKGREADKPFSLHVADVSMVLERTGHLPWRARKLAERYWPGPLTLVLATRDGSDEGFRVPAGAVPRGFLSACPGGVYAPSANPAGKPPAVRAEEAMAYFEGRIPAVLDGGPTPLKQSSCVVRVSGLSVEVLREGILTRDQILAAASRRILFLCTGNSCRSPLAEGILKKLLSERLGVAVEDLPLRGFAVASAGVFSGLGAATPMAIAVARERGIDLTRHQSRRLSEEMLWGADFVFAMERFHLERALECFPQVSGRVFLLDPEGGEVEDPIGGSEEMYRRCASGLERMIHARLFEILKD